jgi:N-succinyldiaminopimelate aminotransferase
LNPHLSRLPQYTFERLRELLAGVTPNPALSPINLSVGEPKHPTPKLILDALAAAGAGVANYPTTAGAPALRSALAAWLARRHGLPALDPCSPSRRRSSTAAGPGRRS